jgi:hypothetical protein
MHRTILLLSAIFSYSVCHAQLPPLRMTSTNLGTGVGYNLEVENNSFANYTLRVNFTTLQGYTSTIQDKGFINVSPHGRSNVGRVTPEKNAGFYSFNYNYTSFLGMALRRIPDTDFVYLLPSTPGNVIRVNKTGSISQRLGIKEENKSYATGFTFHLGDTICAVRAGTVFELLDRAKEGDKHNEVYNINRNKIKIEQKDGTMATYEFLSPIQALVELGDRVNAGQPIAVLNKESDKYHVIIGISYLDERRLADYYIKNDLQAKPDYYITLPAKFHLDPNTNAVITTMDGYTVEHPINIIAEEMSKKEKKKLGL